MRVLLSLVPLLVVVSAQWNPHFVENHDAIVHLFEWKWSDIANECENFLGPYGYGGVQISPVQENIIINQRPWWERYQPVSYLLMTRSGDAAEFEDMVRRCNDVGVRIYADAIMNHMSATSDPCIGTGGTRCFPNRKEYPAVPYDSRDFHSTCSITDYNNASNVRDCELNGLRDLNQSSGYVREQLITFLNELIGYGVAGFRIDAAKHMSPGDLAVIYNGLDDLADYHGFEEGLRPFILQEVIDYGTEAISSTEYTPMGAVTEFKHGMKLSNCFAGKDALKWMTNWGTGWGFMDPKNAIVFVDNHDSQRSNIGGNNILTYKTAKQYKMAVAFMLANGYGIPKIMSSYAFEDKDSGPPADSDGNIVSPVFNEDLSCSGGWVCEHRWRQIYNMVGFRIAVQGTSRQNWWDNGGNQIAFSRGELGFVAFNGDSSDMKETLQTYLPSGTYCDVISGNLIDGACTGKKVEVSSDGKGYIEILKNEEDGVLAIHVNAKL